MNAAAVDSRGQCKLLNSGADSTTDLTKHDMRFRVPAHLCLCLCLCYAYTMPLLDADA